MMLLELNFKSPSYQDHFKRTEHFGINFLLAIINNKQTKTMKSLRYVL